MKKMSKVVTIRIITALMLVSLTLVGSDCEDIINQVTQDPCSAGDISGNWTYIYNTGTLHDICPGETVNFPNNTGGTATLTCPYQTGIERLYTVSGDVLTYTETSTEYNISYDDQCNLVLTGINNARILYYSSTISDKTGENVVSDKNAVNYNSSEIKK